MARQGPRGPQRPVKGFRPGKEPPHLRAQRAKQELGQGNKAQERLIELLASRSPQESRKLMARWRTGLLAGAVALLVGGALLYPWSILAGVAVHLLAAVVLFLWWQLRRQREALETLADVVGGRAAGGARGGGSRR